MKTEKHSHNPVIGIKWHRNVLKALITILILLPQVVLSQTVVTDLQNETVTLDKEKAIDVAKIIKEYERLQDVTKEQLETIRKQDSIIQALTKSNIAGLERVQEQTNRISTLSNSIVELANKQLELEESRRVDFRILGYLEVGNTKELNDFTAKGSIMLQNSKGNIFSVGYDTEQRIYVGYGFSIFNWRK